MNVRKAISVRRYLATVVAIGVCLSCGCTNSPKSLVERHGALRAATLDTEGVFFIDGHEIAPQTSIAIPAEWHAELLQELAAAPVEQPPVAAWVGGGTLRLEFVDGVQTEIEIYNPVGPFKWNGQSYLGDLSVVTRALRHSSGERSVDTEAIDTPRSDAGSR
jgi:hypothetical protein